MSVCGSGQHSIVDQLSTSKKKKKKISLYKVILSHQKLISFSSERFPDLFRLWH